MLEVAPSHFQAIGNRLHDIVAEEGSDKFGVIHQIKDDNKKRELRLEDEEEDFLDEGSKLFLVGQKSILSAAFHNFKDVNATFFLLSLQPL